MNEKKEIIRKPLVSIIIVFLNMEKFIDEAIRSVLSQTYDNWELFLVDDGSTDKSTDIANNYTANSKNIHYLMHELRRNKGISASRNLGLDHANGEFVAFLDADDVWLPKKIEEQIEIMSRYPQVTMIYGRSLYWFGWTGKDVDIKKDFTPDFGIPGDCVLDPPTMLVLLLQKRTPPPSMSAVLVRKQAALSVNGFEDAFTGLYDDQVFYAKVMLNSKIFVSNRCWQLYRKHPDSICVVDFNKCKSIYFQYLKWMEQYLRHHKFIGTEVWKLCKKNLRPYAYPTLFQFMRFVRVSFDYLWKLINTSKRRFQNKSTGWITANPNPVRLHNGSGLGDVDLSWDVIGTESIEIHLNAPGGPLFAKGGPQGSAKTGKWVSDGMNFYLQDTSAKNALVLKNTISRVMVNIIDN